MAGKLLIVAWQLANVLVAAEEPEKLLDADLWEPKKLLVD